MVRWATVWMLVLVTAACGPVFGQGLTKFAPDRPRLVLTPKGPTSDVRAMLLSPDGARLYVAGFDKVVQVYDVAVDPANPARDRLVAGTTLRWEMSRGTNGMINALAMSPDGRRLFVAGAATRAPYGRIVIFDPAQRQIVGALPLDVPTGDNQAMDRLAHTTAVTGLSLSPNGKRLASVSMDGEVRVWAADAPPPANGQTPSLIVRGRQAGAGVGSVNGLEITVEHRVVWVGNDRLIVSERLGAERWVLAEYVIGAGGVQRSPAVSVEHVGGVTSLARSEDGFWASAERSGRVFLWTATKGLDQVPLPAPLVLKGKSTPVGLSFGGGLLSVCVNYEMVDRRKNLGREDSEVQVVRLRPFGLVQTLPTSAFGRTYASVLSADGGRLLTHISDADTDDPNVAIEQRVEGNVARAQAIGDEVVSFRLKAADGALRNEAEVSQTATLVRGRGLPVWHVAFPRKPGDYRIGFSQDGGDHVRQPEWAGRVRREFDLAAGTLKGVVDATEWRQPVENGEGWRVEAEGREVRLFRGRVPVDTLEYPDAVSRFTGRPFTVCLIPDAAGRPVAIAVGTSTVNGVFVYQLPQGQGRRATLLRYYRDHFGKVNSLCASADGRYLVSGAADHTIKLWSLSGLLAPVGAFPQSRAWGCTFQIEGGQLVARNTDPAGIAAGRGFGEGDAILEVLAAGTRAIVEPGAMLKFLAETPITTELIVKVQAAGKPIRQFAVVPAWEPMITLYAEASGEWAAFTPQGYFNSSADDGPELFGWQINLGPATTPEFREGKDLAKEFEREDLLKELLTQGDLKAAFQVVSQAQPGGASPLKDVAVVSRTEAPEVKITAPLDGADVANAPNVVVKAEVTLPPGKTADEFKVTLSSNGTTLATEQGAARPGPNGSTVVDVTGTASPDSQLSRIRAFVGEKDATPRFVADDSVRIRSQKTGLDGKFHLYFVGLACGDYPDPKETGSMYPALEFSKRDVQELLKTFGGIPEAQREYTLHGGSVVRLDKDVTSESLKALRVTVQREITALASPDQNGDRAKVLLVMHITGHGEVVKSADLQRREQELFYFIPTGSVFKTIDDVPGGAISWSVFEEFARIPDCNKIFLVDACRSGAVLERQEAVKSERRLLADHDAIVFSATKGAGEKAQERKDLQHGVFTYYLIEALKGKPAPDKSTVLHEADGFSVDEEGASTKNLAEAEGELRLQEIERYVSFHTRFLTYSSGTEEDKQNPRIGPKDLIEVLHPQIVFLRGVKSAVGDKRTAAVTTISD